MMTGTDIPSGFEPHFRRSFLTDPWEPLYSRRQDGSVVIGLRAASAHTNSRGLVHGGLMSALADNAMGLSCAQTLGNAVGLVTVSLCIDFMAPARVGQWLEFATGFVRTGGTLAFAQCFVTANAEVCARASATFRILGPRHDPKLDQAPEKDRSP